VKFANLPPSDGEAYEHVEQAAQVIETTGNLDETTGQAVLALLDRLTRQAGKNLLMVTHSPESAGWADRVLQLHHGKLEPVAAVPAAVSGNGHEPALQNVAHR